LLGHQGAGLLGHRVAGLLGHRAAGLLGHQVGRSLGHRVVWARGRWANRRPSLRATRVRAGVGVAPAMGRVRGLVGRPMTGARAPISRRMVWAQATIDWPMTGVGRLVVRRDSVRGRGVLRMLERPGHRRRRLLGRMTNSRFAGPGWFVVVLTNLLLRTIPLRAMSVAQMGIGQEALASYLSTRLPPTRR
jgi:hypothetical protein